MASAKWEEKKLRIRENLGEYDDQYLIEGYRLNRNLFENACDLVKAS